MTLAGIKKVVREIHSEPNGGTLSWGRCASSGSLIAAVVWVCHVVFVTHVLPDMAGLSGFVVAPFAANKVATAVQSFSQNPVNQVPGK